MKKAGGSGSGGPEPSSWTTTLFRALKYFIFGVATVLFVVVGFILYRAFHLHHGTFSYDTTTRSPNLNDYDNRFFIPGQEVRFNLQIYDTHPLNCPKHISITPYLCYGEFRCIRTSLVAVDAPRLANEYRITAIAYRVLHGTDALSSLGKDQTLVSIGYFDEGAEINMLEEITGVIDDPDFLFIHPPRSSMLALTQLCPMISVPLPLGLKTCQEENLSVPNLSIPQPYNERFPNGLSLASDCVVLRQDDAILPQLDYQENFIVTRNGRISTNPLFSQTIWHIAGDRIEKIVFKVDNYAIFLSQSGIK